MIGLCRVLLLYIEKWFSVVQTNVEVVKFAYSRDLAIQALP
jgi:hypothetical protein